MNKLLLVTVLAALLALSAEGYRMPRQAEAAAEEEEQGTMSRIKSSIKSMYDSTVDTAVGYMENIKGMNLDKQAVNLYHETINIMSMYTGVMQDQLYHIFYSQ